MSDQSTERMSTGVPGLDEILDGGMIPGRVYLARGAPGVGKTTLGLHFLSEGVARGESVLFVTLADSEDKIRSYGSSVGFALDKINFLDLSPRSKYFAEDQAYDIFAAGEVEREPITRKIVDAVGSIKPRRVLVDPTSHLRYLSQDPFQFRRQMISLLRFLVESGSTVIWTSEAAGAVPDDDFQYMSDAVINLEFVPGGWSIRISKYLGSGYRVGPHSMKLSDHGMQVFPRLEPQAHAREFTAETLTSGVPELDQMLGGGLERGTIAIISGPSGVGKTTVSTLFAVQAAAGGERVAYYAFEEEVDIALQRFDSLGIPARDLLERGLLSLEKIEPLEFTADEFAQVVRREVEQRKARLVVIDSIAGYKLCLRGEDLIAHLHALCKYLQNMGVLVILINEVEYITGDFRATEHGVSYMADTILFLRYFESRGQILKAVGVLKKRLSDFEKSMRVIEITSGGVKLGEPTTQFQGILRGLPAFAESPES